MFNSRSQSMRFTTMAIARELGLTINVKTNTEYAVEKGPYFGGGKRNYMDELLPKDMHIGLPIPLTEHVMEPGFRHVRSYVYEFFRKEEIPCTAKNAALYSILHEIGHVHEYKSRKFNKKETIEHWFTLCRNTIPLFCRSYEEYANSPRETYANNFAKEHMKHIIQFVEDKCYTIY